MAMSIYTPEVLAYARRHGVSDLRAYHLVKQRDATNRAKPFTDHHLCK